MKAFTIPERLQAAVFSVTERTTYRPSKLPSLPSETIIKFSESTNKSNLVSGSLVFATLADYVLGHLPDLEDPESPSYRMVLGILGSPQTSARVLLATRSYGDHPGCPFIGMDAAEISDSLLRFLGLHASTPDSLGIFRLAPWFVHAYQDLAAAAARALDLLTTVRLPQSPAPTRFPETRVTTQQKKKERKSASRTLPTVTVLRDSTNVDSVSNRSAESSAGGKKRSETAKPGRATPYPPPGTPASSQTSSAPVARVQGGPVLLSWFAPPPPPHIPAAAVAASQVGATIVPVAPMVALATQQDPTGSDVSHPPRFRPRIFSTAALSSTPPVLANTPPPRPLPSGSILATSTQGAAAAVAGLVPETSHFAVPERSPVYAAPALAPAPATQHTPAAPRATAARRAPSPAAVHSPAPTTYAIQYHRRMPRVMHAEQ
ncbi:hypothetical protein B0H11DRAFT_2115764 [Mycena galericulata]|nr:hypothetical protein B0H11DRAFT_2115764 [Mycena galericulata]